ncbi:MAG TPA: outer membrane lipoprotein chaperone LolA [Steroidobacteraceae bacterium]|nr:outer membrane lipoprotein chaperone LolA [Steroidobacteraceae bacterium]
MKHSSGRQMFRRLFPLSGLLVALGAASLAHGQTPLDDYLAHLKTLRTGFSQVVTDGRGLQVQKAAGTLLIVRPGKFRWELTPDGSAAPQLMVADGKNLWFYDRDLEQVSVKSAATALTATPASLLAGDENIRELFTVSPAGRRDGFDWVKVVPKQGDADFREAQLAFNRSELKRMVLKDKLGQTVRLEFVSSERNAPVSDAEVKFTPPQSADVIGTPVP